MSMEFAEGGYGYEDFVVSLGDDKVVYRYNERMGLWKEALDKPGEGGEE